MSTAYNEDIVGAIEVLVDLMSGNDFAMTREPYAPNYRGLVDALIDLKEGFPLYIPTDLGFKGLAGETINQGSAVYLDHSTGQLYKAIASGTEAQAHVIGFANQTKLAGELIQIVTAGLIGLSSLSIGSHYYLSDSTAGAIVFNPPTGAGKYVTFVGQAASATQFVIQLEPPIKLS